MISQQIFIQFPGSAPYKIFFDPTPPETTHSPPNMIFDLNA